MNLSDIHDLILTYAPEQLNSLKKTLKELKEEMQEAQPSFVQAIAEAQKSRNFERAHELLEAEEELLQEIDEIDDMLGWEEEIEHEASDVHAEETKIEAIAKRTPLDTSLDEIGLPKKARQMLQRRKLHTLGDVVSLSEREVLQIRNVGPACLRQIKQCVTACGWALAEDKQKH